MALYDPGRPGALQQSGTFNANPITTAAGIAGLTMLTPAEIDRLNGLGDRLRGRLQVLFDASPVRARVTGVGSLLQVHFTEADVVDYRGSAGDDPMLRAAFHLALLLEGAFVAPRGMMALSLPMGDAEVDEAAAAAERALGHLLVSG